VALRVHRREKSVADIAAQLQESPHVGAGDLGMDGAAVGRARTDQQGRPRPG